MTLLALLASPAWAVPLPAVGTSAAVADGPGLVFDLGVGAGPFLPDGRPPIAPRASVGWLAGPTDDALLLGVVAGTAATVPDLGDVTTELRLTGAVGSPLRTTWVGLDLAAGPVLRDDGVVLRGAAVGTLAADLDPLTTITVRMGAVLGHAVAPTLGLGFVYRPSRSAHVAVGADAERHDGLGLARYPSSAHVTFGGRVGPDTVQPEAPGAYSVEAVRDAPEDFVDVREHPMLTCPGDALPTGRPPPLGREAWCVRVVGEEVVRDGPFVRWHDVANVAEVGHFTLGQRSGAWSAYDPEGMLREAGLFEHDLEQGLWTTYYPSGGIEERATFVDGELHGPWELFAPEGHVTVVGAYEHGRRTGVWLDLSLEGVPVRERLYEAGRLVQQRELGASDAP